MSPTGVTGWDDTGNNKAYLSGQIASILNSGSIVNTMKTTDPAMLAKTSSARCPAKRAVPRPSRAATRTASSPSTSRWRRPSTLIKGTLSKERYPGNLNAANPMFFPVLKDYANIPLFKDDPVLAQIASLLQYSKVFPNYDGEPQAWIDDMGAQWKFSEMTSRVVVDGWTPQKALEDFAKQAEASKAKFAKK